MNLVRMMLAIMLVLVAYPACAAESGVALKADAFRVEPSDDAKTVAILAIGDKVEILNKNGDWLKVRSAKGSGWVRLLSIRKGDAAKGFEGLLDLPSGRNGTGKIVVSSGIRGRGDSTTQAPKSINLSQPEQVKPK